MLQKAVDYSLARDDYQVADIMTRNVAEVDVGISIAESAERMWSARIGALAVVERGRPVGIATEHDILRALLQDIPHATPIGAVASRSILSCSPQSPLATAFALMQSHGVRHLLVLADGGLLLGIVSDTDFRDGLATHADPNTSVELLMEREVPILPTEATFDAALEAMARRQTGCVMAVDAARKPIGILTVRDSVRLFDRHALRGETPLHAVMSQPVLQIPGTGTADEALQLMRRHRVRHLAVVGPDAALAGVLMENELVRHMELGRHHTIERLKLAASVYDHAQEGILITDPAGIVIDVNAAFERITGYRFDEVVGQRAGDPIRSGQHPPEFYRDMWRSLAATGLWRGEIVNRRRNGELLVEMLTISAVRGSSGAVSHYVGVFTDITELRKNQERLAFLNHYDPLTRLPNRTLLDDRVRTAVLRARGIGQLAAVAYLDLDGFGPVNDRVGHETGDRILVEIAGRLQHALRPGDTVARIASDEFVLLLPDIARHTEVERILEHVLTSLGAPLHEAPELPPPTASIGVSLAPVDGDDADVLIRNANHAVLSAKRAGGNCYHLFDSDREHLARTSREVLGQVRAALQRGELTLYYQPQVNLRGGRIEGVEALLRWNDPQRGMVPPGEFLPFIEDTDFMVVLGDWVLDTALRQLKDWLAQGLRPKLSVNLAAQQLRQADFIERLRATLARHPEVPAALLELEILETVALQDMDHVVDVIRDCQKLGIEFALDDFGTGYASLTHFRDLPARILKIDQSFVRGMLEEPANLAIIEAIIGLSAAFQRVVVAEGVETEEQGILLMRLGCDIVQGYGFARPMPAAQCGAWMAAFQARPEWNALGNRHIPREEFPLLAAELQLRNWVDRFVQGATGTPPNMSEAEAGDEQYCAFGRWYFGAGQAHFGDLPIFLAIDATHHRLHRVAVQLVRLWQAGDTVKYRARLDEMMRLRDRILAQFVDLRELLGHRTMPQLAFPRDDTASRRQA